MKISVYELFVDLEESPGLD